MCSVAQLVVLRSALGSEQETLKKLMFLGCFLWEIVVNIDYTVDNGTCLQSPGLREAGRRSIFHFHSSRTPA